MSENVSLIKELKIPKVTVINFNKPVYYSYTIGVEKYEGDSTGDPYVCICVLDKVKIWM